MILAILSSIIVQAFCSMPLIGIFFIFVFFIFLIRLSIMGLWEEDLRGQMSSSLYHIIGTSCPYDLSQLVFKLDLLG